MQFSISDQ